MNLVELSGVSCEYPRGETTVTILDNVDLVVRQGEFLVLLGPSGSGKTTILHHISTLLAPTAGTVRVAGRVVSTLTPREAAHFRAETTGYVFQQPNLIPTLTAFENVELPLHLLELSADERATRVALALDLVGLSDHFDKLPRQLSGGQEQRVGIARAIVADPPLLLADEPTGALDAESADAVLGLLKRLQLERGKTIVLVTHDARATRFGDRIVRVDKGLLREEPAP